MADGISYTGFLMVTAMISGMADVQRNTRVPVRVVLRARLLPGSIARFVRPRRREPFSLPVRKSRQRRRRGRLSRFCNRRDVRPVPRYTLVDAGRHSYSWCFYAGRHSMRSLRVRMQTC